jgi:hypothetical protein
MQKELLTTIEKEKKIESYPTVRLIIEDIRRTAEYASDIGEVVLNLNVDQMIAR